MKAEFTLHGLRELANWLNIAAQMETSCKADQDKVDACLCLIPGLRLLRGETCLMVGDLGTGYIVVPFNASLE